MDLDNTASPEVPEVPLGEIASDILPDVPEVPEVPEAPNGQPDDGSLALDVVSEQQIQQAADSLQDVPGLDPGVWDGLDPAEKLGVLQEIEGKMAAIQGRPEVEVTVADMKPSEFGGWNGQSIQLNAAHLEGAANLPVEEFLNTIVHEGRHAFQDHAVNNPGFVADQGLVSGWAENMTNYLSAEEYGQELYQAQPLEADAWRYADRLVHAMIARK